MNALWPPPVDIFQYGTFTESEAETLRRCVAKHRPVLQLMSDPAASTYATAYSMAARALETVSELVTEASHFFRPELRLIGFFGRATVGARACNAQSEATEIPGTFLIEMHFEGIRILYEFIGHDIGDLDPELVRELAGSDPSSTVNYCVQLATEFLLLHELAHVIRGHLDLVTGDPSNHVLRRSVETDADHFAARFLKRLLMRHMQHQMSPGEEQKPLLAWWLSALIASLAVFQAFTEPDAVDPGYHRPLTRLSQVAQLLDPGIPRASERMLPALLAGLEKRYRNLTPEQHSLRAANLRRDDTELRSRTIPYLQKLISDGRLRGWAKQ